MSYDNCILCDKGYPVECLEMVTRATVLAPGTCAIKNDTGGFSIWIPYLA